jgi:FkbM family methyltransferase
MNAHQVLLPIYRTLRPIVDRCRLNALARPVWAVLWKKQSTNLVHAEQNDRVWWLDPDVALRGTDAEIETVKWLRSVIEPGMTVIDVGANVGQLTLEMAHLVGPTGRVIAIEPGPGNLAVLRRQVEGNGFAERVTIIAAACCTLHSSKMELEIPGQTVDTVGSGFQLRGIGISQNPAAASLPIAKLTVNTVSLDGVMAELKVAPAVLKIDVEGAEVEVLRGGRDLLHKNRPALAVGFHPFAFKQPDAAQAEIIALCGEAGLRFENQDAKPWGLDEYFASAC